MSNASKPHCSPEQLDEALELARRWPVEGATWHFMSDTPKLARAVLHLEEQYEDVRDKWVTLDAEYDHLKEQYEDVRDKWVTLDAEYDHLKEQFDAALVALSGLLYALDNDPDWNRLSSRQAEDAARAVVAGSNPASEPDA